MWEKLEDCIDHFEKRNKAEVELRVRGYKDQESTIERYALDSRLQNVLIDVVKRIYITVGSLEERYKTIQDLGIESLALSKFNRDQITELRKELEELKSQEITEIEDRELGATVWDWLSEMGLSFCVMLTFAIPIGIMAIVYAVMMMIVFVKGMD